ncbi:MAG: hypothetical protein LBR49_00510, partial [Tannerella sp.]|nr:hypothetical protein [Tannerella sp.]
MNRLAFIVTSMFIALFVTNAQSNLQQAPSELMGHRFLTLNTVIRVNQIEVARDRNEGWDESAIHTPEAV